MWGFGLDISNPNGGGVSLLNPIVNYTETYHFSDGSSYTDDFSSSGLFNWGSPSISETAINWESTGDSPTTSGSCVWTLSNPPGDFTDNYASSAPPYGDKVIDYATAAAVALKSQPFPNPTPTGFLSVDIQLRAYP
jgi:hypothetical protein